MPVRAHDSDAARTEATRAFGAEPAGTIAEAVEGAGVVISTTPDDETLE